MDSALTKLVIMVTVDGEPWVEVGDVGRLAKLLEGGVYGYADVAIFQLQSFGAGNRLVDVEWAVTALHYNEDDWAYPVVTVVLPDGRTESASYRVDGRA